MNKLSGILTLLIFPLILSCSNVKNDDSTKRQDYFEFRQTASQGTKKAKADLQDGYRIFRYDMPGIRTGAWSEYYARYKHFGIKETSGGWNESLDFMKAYNVVMDSALKKKYAKEYLKYRSKLIPAEDAVIYTNQYSKAITKNITRKDS